MPAGSLTRDRPIRKGRAALLIVDVQNGTFSAAFAQSKPEFHAAASARVIPNIRRLLDSFRRASLEVIYTMIENLTEDGRDRSLDYKLCNIGIEDLFVVGFLTDQCIDHVIKDGADCGYYMSCVHDACAAETKARHEAALSGFKGYCRMLSTDAALRLVAQAQ